MNNMAKLGIALLTVNEVRGVIFVAKDGAALIKSAWTQDISGLTPLLIDIPIIVIIGFTLHYVKNAICGVNCENNS